MGTISSGVGLTSGMDIEGIVTQLMQIESRPRLQLEERIEALTEKQTALMSLQAQIVALQVSMAGFNKDSIFQKKSILSSNEDVITATATRFAELGSHKFRVKQLASNHHFVSRGYSSLRSSVGTGTISFEIGQGQLAKPTDLSFINGQLGFQRGTISITDRAGNTDEIDLSVAQTMQDVIDKINSSEVSVEAKVAGDHLVITDLSGGAGTLQISGAAAESLGIATSSSDGTITGEKIYYITQDTLLKSLNDGNGVRGLGSGDDLKFVLKDGTEMLVDLRSTLHEVVGGEDTSNKLQSLNSGQGVRLGTFRITDQNGKTLDIDLTDLGEDATLRQLKDKIETEAAANNMNITVAFNSLDHLTITDSSTASESAEGTDRASHFIIEDLDGGSAAADLGIVDDIAGSNIYGEQIWHMETVGDVMNAINNHWANNDRLVVSINEAGTGLDMTDNFPEGNLIISNMYSKAAEDLRIVTAETGASDPTFHGRRLIGGMNTVLMRSLKGGSGGDGGNQMADGTIRLNDRAGAVADIDISADDTLQEVIDKVNGAGIQLQAAVNQNGNGMVLTDTSGGTGNLTIADVTGDVAAKLGINVDQAVSSMDSGNLQLQYLSGATRLDDMRQGQGISRDKFTITDGKGSSYVVDLSQNDVNTIEDVIRKFELSGTNVRARINDNGDGLLLYDLSEGLGLAPIKVVEKGGNAASDLNILGPAQQADDGSYYIDGSFEFKVDVGGGDNIEDVVSYINNADIGLKASIINDGSAGNPYRISFTSEVSGRAGTVYLDAGQTNLTVQDLSKAQDAIVFLGDGSDDASLMITSSTNAISDAMKGITFELKGTSNESVDITVSEDLESITTQIKTFVGAYNEVMKKIKEVDRFNSETLERSVLFSDSSVRSAQRTLVNMVQRIVPGLSDSFNRLSQVGIKFTSVAMESGTNASGETVNYAVARTPQLDFDEEAFLQAYAEDPDSVTDLFTKAETGFGDYINDQLERLAGTSGTSTIKSRLNSMQSGQKLLEDRISYLDELLEAKETRLYNQFYAMEQALANMQSQQSALTSLSSLAASMQN